MIRPFFLHGFRYLQKYVRADDIRPYDSSFILRLSTSGAATE